MKLVPMGLMLALGVGHTSLLAQTASGDFIHSPRIDDFTDEDRSNIAVIAEDNESVLVWRCDPNGMAVMLTTGYMIGEDDKVDIMWRVDRDEPSPTVRGSQNTANTAAFLPANRVYSFTREAKAGATVIFQVTDPFDREPERHRFSLMGLTASLRLLSCYEPPDVALAQAGVPEGSEWVVDTQER